MSVVDKTQAAQQDSSASSKSNKMNKPSIVLVHGAWHGGWCWRYVAKLLRNSGYQVFTPTMTGLGERSHLQTPTPTLETHIQDIVNVVNFNELDDFILIGHSYGGMVITAVADRLKDKIRHVVYLDAAVPRDGESMLSQDPNSTTESIAITKSALEELAPDGVWMQTLPAVVLGVSPELTDLTAWLERRMTPHPLPTWFDAVELNNGGADELPKTYIHCVGPVMPSASFAAHAAILKNKAGWRYRELATGHDAMVTEPELLADEIIAVSKLA